MAINLDDIRGESTVSGSKGVTCNHIEINFRFEDGKHVAAAIFHQAEVTVLSTGDVITTQLPAQAVRLSLADGALTIPVLNRRTLAPTGVTRTVDVLMRDIMSTYHYAVEHAVSAPPPPPPEG